MFSGYRVETGELRREAADPHQIRKLTHPARQFNRLSKSVLGCRLGQWIESNVNLADAKRL